MRNETFHPFRSEKEKQRYMKFYQKREQEWPVQNETKMIETSYGKTFVRISGLNNSEPLILMHGACDNSISWIENIVDLSERYIVYAIDDIYGNTMSISTCKITSIDDYMKWFDELFEGIGINRKVNMVGMSLGGWQIANYALHNPQLVNKIVVIAPPNFVIPCSMKFGLRSMLALLPSKFFTKSLVYWIFKDLVESGQGNEKSKVDFFVECLYLGLRCFKLRPLVPTKVFTREQLLSFKMPVLFMIGENDKSYCATEAVEQLNKIAPNIRTEIVRNAGHDLIIVQAENFYKLLNDFLE